jgi:Asp/Glu/hydantoin racemase
MNTKIALARTLIRNTDLPVAARRQQLNQLTADVRREYDQHISAIRAEIAALGITAAGAIWQTIVGVVTGVPFRRATSAAAIAKLRVQLAEVHTAKFAALAELKILKALV